MLDLAAGAREQAGCGPGQASRVIIRQAPMPDQTTIQPTITDIIAQVGYGLT